MSEERQRFDPSRHFTKVSGNQYLQVKHRVMWFRDQYPDGSIVTELVGHEPLKWAVVKATVTTGDGMATGYGMEEQAKFGDYLEKAETKAIGRALAGLGFGTEGALDFDVGPERAGVADSPSPPRRIGPQGLETLQREAVSRGWTNDDLMIQVFASFGGTDWEGQAWPKNANDAFHRMTADQGRLILATIRTREVLESPSVTPPQ